MAEVPENQQSSFSSRSLEQEASIERLEMSPETKFAASLSLQAGQIIVARANQLQERTFKSRTDFKTAVDDECDRMIRAAIETSYPDDSINSEELEAKETNSEYRWLVDPLDGTIGYTLQSSDHVSASIARAHNNIPVLGAINVALKGELFVAERGKGAFVNGQPIRVGSTSEVNQAVVGIDYGKKNRLEGVPVVSKLLGPDGVSYPVTYAGAAASLALLASGRLDGYASHDLEPWDMAAAVVICEEAGAIVTTLDGRPWDVTESTILVANNELHPKLLELIAA